MPGTDGVVLGIGPGDMPERDNRGVGQMVANDLRDERQMIILHDGMNLVAKEFVAARDDDQGVLILSQFTGAACELPEALIINPYHIDQCAAALHLALSMSPVEQRARMRSMRGIVQEFNVYRWAGRMLLDAARMRQRARLMREVGEPDMRVISGGRA